MFEGFFVVKKFTENLSDQVFRYEPCTNESFGGGAPLHVRDPYEVKTAKLGPSTIPNSGEGVILLKDVPRLRFANMYSLFMYKSPDQDKLYRNNCIENTNK